MIQSLTPEQRAAWERDGFLIVRGLISPAEAAQMRAHFTAMHAQTVPGRYEPRSLEACGGDVLKHFPRVLHPHRFDALSLRQMLDERVRAVLCGLFGEEPLAAQSMFYFKPPGAKGQALHQDNFYLRVSPGTCIAAWLAVDRANEENGGMFVVPGSHRFEVLCPQVANPQLSFTAELVEAPDGTVAVPVVLDAGDVLFFGGSAIHGSYPNTSDRFRRAFICHYVPDSMAEMAHHYYPLHRFTGETLTRDVAPDGGICGTEEWAALNQARAAAPE